FNEMPEGSLHAHYLWGNPAFACVYLLAQAYSHYGWNFRPGVLREIDGLPLHVYQEAGDSQLKPCAEVLLTEPAAEAILDHGLCALSPSQVRDALSCGPSQPIAPPPRPLAGRWHW